MSVPLGIVCTPEEYARSIEQPETIHCLRRPDNIGLMTEYNYSNHIFQSPLLMANRSGACFLSLRDMSRSNGRLEAEVIVSYADGFAYSKHKMEEAFRPGGFLDKPPAKSPHVGTKDASAPPKREDVDLIIHEFEIPRAQAEKILSESGGDLEKALVSLVASK